MSSEEYPTREQFVYSLALTGHQLAVRFVENWGDDGNDYGFIVDVVHFEHPNTIITEELPAAMTVDEAIDNALEQWFGWCPEK